MTRIRVEVEIDAPPAAVWAAIEDVSTHTDWMAEAVAIRFRSDQRSGVGTEVECDTKLGPFTTTDLFRFVEWDPPHRMGIVHEGTVSGAGTFILEPVPGRRSGDGAGGTVTRFVWDEELTFPARFGGRVGGIAGAAALRLVWRRNLARLKRLVEAGRP